MSLEFKHVGILTDKDAQFMRKIMPEMIRIQKVNQQYRTPVEMNFSVLNDMKFPSKASKYFQSIREQTGMFRSLVFQSLEYEELKADLEIAEIELTELDPNTNKYHALTIKKQVQIKRLQYQIKLLEQEAHARIREIKNWEKIKDELVRQNPDFNINDVDAHQIESLKQRWANEIRIGKLSTAKEMTSSAIAQYETIKYGKEKKT